MSRYERDCIVCGESSTNNIQEIHGRNARVTVCKDCQDNDDVLYLKELWETNTVIKFVRHFDNVLQKHKGAPTLVMYKQMRDYFKIPYDDFWLFNRACPWGKIWVSNGKFVGGC